MNNAKHGLHKGKNTDSRLHIQQSQQRQAKPSTIVTQVTKEDRILEMLNGLNIKMSHLIRMLGEQK
jgi:hypothetical protein